jgi:hypothetical protein
VAQRRPWTPKRTVSLGMQLVATARKAKGRGSTAVPCGIAPSCSTAG